MSINFANLGFETNYFFIVVGDISLFASLIGIQLLLAWVFLKYSKNVKLHKKAKQWREANLFKRPIILFDETYLITVIASLMGVVFYRRFDLTHFGQLINFGAALVMLIPSLLWPFFQLYLLVT